MHARYTMSAPNRLLTLFGLVILISACTSGALVPLRTPLTHPPLFNQAPTKVAVRYTNNLRNHTCLVSRGYIAESWQIQMGPASIKMFDQIFDSLFEEVITLDSQQGTSIATDKYSLIDLEMLAYDGCDAAWPITGTPITVAYEAILRSPDGNVIARWQGRGSTRSGEEVSPFEEGLPRIGVEAWYLSAATRLAMRRAAADFIFNFDANPKIQAWLGR